MNYNKIGRGLRPDNRQTHSTTPISSPSNADSTHTKSTTLASLLSSQRRSAAQSERHRVQMTRPFANLDNDRTGRNSGASNSLKQSRWDVGSTARHSSQLPSTYLNSSSSCDRSSLSSYRGSNNSSLHTGQPRSEINIRDNDQFRQRDSTRDWSGTYPQHFSQCTPKSTHVQNDQSQTRFSTEIHNRSSEKSTPLRIFSRFSPPPASTPRPRNDDICRKGRYEKYSEKIYNKQQQSDALENNGGGFKNRSIQSSAIKPILSPYHQKSEDNNVAAYGDLNVYSCASNHVTKSRNRRVSFVPPGTTNFEKLSRTTSASAETQQSTVSKDSVLTDNHHVKRCRMNEDDSCSNGKKRLLSVCGKVTDDTNMRGENNPLEEKNPCYQNSAEQAESKMKSGHNSSASSHVPLKRKPNEMVGAKDSISKIKADLSWDCSVERMIDETDRPMVTPDDSIPIAKPLSLACSSRSNEGNNSSDSKFQSIRSHMTPNCETQLKEIEMPSSVETCCHNEQNPFPKLRCDNGNEINNEKNRSAETKIDPKQLFSYKLDSAKSENILNNTNTDQANTPKKVNEEGENDVKESLASAENRKEFTEERVIPHGDSDVRLTSLSGSGTFPSKSYERVVQSRQDGTLAIKKNSRTMVDSLPKWIQALKHNGKPENATKQDSLPQLKSVEPSPSHPSSEILAKIEPILEAKTNFNESGPPQKKIKKKDFRTFRVKVGCVVAVRFRPLADGGNPGVLPVVKLGESYSALNSVNDSTMKTIPDDSVSRITGEKTIDTESNLRSVKLKETVENIGSEGTGCEKTDGPVKIGKDETLSHEKTNDSSNHNSPTIPRSFEIWADPVHGQDDGISLLGSRIRCFFPKSTMALHNKKISLGSKVPHGRVLEGNVVSLLGFNRGGGSGTAVGLLVDNQMAKSFPFLKVVTETSDDPNMSSAEQKRRQLETVIKGKGKVIVRVILSSIFDRIKCNNMNPGVVSQWVVRRRVSFTPMADKKSIKILSKRKRHRLQSLFVGDGNDCPQQQERNWRWVASRSFCSGDEILDRMGTHDTKSDSAPELVGEVVKMEVGPNNISGVAQSLATVTMRRLFTPEQTRGGRSLHHGALELFDCLDDAESNKMFFQAPVEDLIVIGKRVIRYYDVDEHDCVADTDGEFSITHSYHLGNDTYAPLSNEDVDSGKEQSKRSSLSQCHYCRRLKSSSSMLTCRRHKTNQIFSSLWCSLCLELCKHPSTTDCDVDDWCGPCCTGKCDCRVCSSSPSKKIARPLRSIRDGVQYHSALADDCCATCGVGLDTEIVNCISCKCRFHKNCAQWRNDLFHLRGLLDSSDLHQFTCHKCNITGRHRKTVNSRITKYNVQNATLSSLIKALELADPMKFDIPRDFGQISPAPSIVPNTGIRSKTIIQKSPTNRKGVIIKGVEGKKRKRLLSSETRADSRKKTKIQHNCDEPEEEAIFKPTCCRIIPFDQIKKVHHYLSHGKTASSAQENVRQPFRRNARARGTDSKKNEQKSTVTDRAARANQRRMLKSLASLGDVSKLKVDRLAGRDREQQLRFGKSLIHGWGVFAEEPISAGDMIIEYRGELIGNAVADKRELEYERANIGSDYMFRIDEFTVCDATKLGNVARFINASCSPNCHTQIITANENKRIVIYAKRNIQRGEELVYDYKFQLEYDEAKRIPCHCGSSECRGFMNWDKRYTVVNEPNDSAT